jgi:hypothetical protein
VTDHDGALTAGIKAVLMGAASSAQRDAELARHELGRAAASGVGTDIVWAAGAVLLSSRGEGSYGRYAAAAQEHFDLPPAGEDSAPPTEEADALREAEEWFARSSGSLPEYAALLREHAPGALTGYARLVDGSWNQPALSPQEVQLLLVCVNVAAIRPEFAAHHSRLARRAGASPAQVVEAGVCAIPSGGVTAWYGSGDRLLES